jgi:uncharacterized coiled-coil protein SlyX
MTTEARLDRLEQQNAEIKKLLEDLIKNSALQQASMDQLQQRIEEKLDSKESKEEKDSRENSTTRTSDKAHHENLNSMSSLDFQPTEDVKNLVNPQDPFCHVEAPFPQPNLTTTQFRHYSKIAPSPPTIESQHKTIYKSATHCPTNPSLTKKIHQPTLLQKLYLVTYRATTISNPHRTVKENRRVQIWTLGDKVAFPLSERPPRKRMKVQRRKECKMRATLEEKNFQSSPLRKRTFFRRGGTL